MWWAKIEWTLVACQSMIVIHPGEPHRVTYTELHWWQDLYHWSVIVDHRTFIAMWLVWPLFLPYSNVDNSPDHISAVGAAIWLCRPKSLVLLPNHGDWVGTTVLDKPTCSEWGVWWFLVSPINYCWLVSPTVKHSSWFSCLFVDCYPLLLLAIVKPIVQPIIDYC